MEPQHNPYGPSGQPGLEVVHHADLEVAAQERLPYGQSLPEWRADEYFHGGKEATTPVYSEDPEHYPLPATYPPHAPPAELAATGQAAKKRRLWFVIGGVIALVVILAAVLGGVLGSRAANSSGESSASQTGGSSGGSNQNPSSTGNTTDTSSNSTTQLQSIRRGSGLSVTGSRKPGGGGVETYLFYQDPENGLRYSRCDTSRRTPSNASACWESPVSFNSFADAGARLAASTILWGDRYQPQTQLVYTGFKTRMLGLNINPQLQPNISEDSVNRLEVFTGPNSSLAAYWPWTLYQDSTGVLYHVRNLLGGNFEPSTSTWDDNRINITALAASRLAVVPTSTNFSLIAVKAGYAVFYQTPDATDSGKGKLAVSITDLNHPQVPRGFTQPWPVTLPEIILPAKAPLAAFSVARPNDTLQRVNTYVLYLNADGDIAVLYTDASGSEVEWKTAQPSALKGADRDTDIACLNMATSFWDAAETGVLLEGASAETARCFFQRSGRVVEARLDVDVGGQKGEVDWVVVGEVSMA